MDVKAPGCDYGKHIFLRQKVIPHRQQGIKKVPWMNEIDGFYGIQSYMKEWIAHDTVNRWIA